MGTGDITKLQSRGLDPRADLLVCVPVCFVLKFLFTRRSVHERGSRAVIWSFAIMAGITL